MGIVSYIRENYSPMAFRTYQCEQYIKFLKNYESEVISIYSVIGTAPFTKQAIADALGMDRSTYSKKVDECRLTTEELIKILEFIK